jgi:hypothetical protein
MSTEMDKRPTYEKFLPVIPLIGTAIAIAFDVGYFYGVGINFFTLFSLTEHISFAFEALPIAISILVVAVIIDALTERLRFFGNGADPKELKGSDSLEEIRKSIHQLNLELKRLRRRRFWIRAGMTVFAVAALTNFWYADELRTFLFFCVLILTTVVGIIAPARWYSSDPATLLFVGGVLAILTGEFLGSSYVTGIRPAETITLKSKENPVPARIIRAGERGVLFARPDTGTVEFELWENIRSLSAKIGPSGLDSWLKSKK